MITQAFGRDERSFILKCRGWREVEKACDAGLGVIAARLAPVQLTQGGVASGQLPAAIAAGGASARPGSTTCARCCCRASSTAA
jgi:hypothetical protein